MIKLAPEEFAPLARYIEAISGISLDPSKGYLIETRLSGLVEELGFSSYRDLAARAASDPGKGIQNRIIDAITTRETLFFRDTSPFELLRNKLLPDLIDARCRAAAPSAPIDLRIWSAAASSGQEIYSIAMILKELLPVFGRFKVKLLGTDLSDAAITQASIGRYNGVEIERGLPREKLLKYFVAEGDCWRVRDEIRALATFQKANLLEDFGRLGQFDVIFCRNVAIYFTEQNKNRLFQKLENALAPDGYLVIGSTESLSGVPTRFIPKNYLRSVFYQLS